MRRLCRRDVLKGMGMAPLAVVPLEGFAAEEARFKISLAQWSLHRALRSGELDNLDYASFTRKTFGIDAVEYVNQFFADGKRSDPMGLQPKPKKYMAEMKQRGADAGVENVLLMCDGVGQLGDPDDARRGRAVEGHFTWCDVAKSFGCHSIRVNAGSDMALSYDEQAKLCADGLRRLSEHAATKGLSVIVENHGGLSSDGAWLAGVMERVALDNCGTLPDFGNFHVARRQKDEAAWAKTKERFGEGTYGEDARGLYFDRYEGIRLLMPYAKGVSAKSHDFDEEGNDRGTDFFRAMRIVKDAGYRGYVGIEFEGGKLSEVEGIKKTKALLERVFAMIEV